MTVKDLKQGDYFTIKEIEEPSESQVWVRGYYDRADKAYVCHNFGDINRSRTFKSSKQVFTDFTF